MSSHHALPLSGKGLAGWLARIGLGLALVSFVLGLVAYRVDGKLPWGDAVFRTLQLFHLHYHDLQHAWEHRDNRPPGAHGKTAAPAGASAHEGAAAQEAATAHGDGHSTDLHETEYGPKQVTTWPLRIARFGAAAVALSLIPGLLIVSFFREQLTRLWVRHFVQNHVIVCGQCPRTMSLIKDLAKPRPGLEQKGIVYIGRCPDHHVELPPGVVYLEGDAYHGKDLLQAAGVARASDLVALYEEDRMNLAILVTAARECREQRTQTAKLECHAHIQDSHLKSGVHKYLANDLCGGRVNFHFFNYYELAARSLACRHPVPEALVEAQPDAEHYVIVGFGAFGQNVALKLVKMGQQLIRDEANSNWSVVKPRITVIDPRGSDAAEVFLRAHPHFKDQCDWHLMPYSSESAEFLDLKFLSPDDGPAKTSIIYCLDDEGVSLRSALLLHDLCRTSQRAKDVDAIYVRLARPEDLGLEADNACKAPGKPHLHLFAADSEILNGDAILRWNLDVLAMHIHAAYLQVEKADRREENRAPAAGTLWANLSEEDREGNREAADHLWAKLRTLGYDLRPAPTGDAAPEVPDTLLKDLESRVEELACAEHYRWMTLKVLDGWQFGEKRTSKEDISAGEPKRHPDMVPYEKLSETTKEKDRVNIRIIPTLLRKGSLIATKRKQPTD